MKKLLIGFGLILTLLLIAAIFLGGAYVSGRNEMVSQKEAIRAAWAQVDNVLQRRADLIPNLVNTVKGYATHEQKVFDDIASARAQLGWSPIHPPTESQPIASWTVL